MKKAPSIIIVLALLMVPFFAFAQAVISPSASVSTAIPGMSGGASSSTSPGAFVVGFYNFALMISGVLALGAIVYGGVLYATSGGNPGKQSEGREYIESALLGLLLLGGAYLILYTINPELVDMNLPSLSAVNIAGPSTGGGGTTPSNGTCNLPNCQTLPNCTPSGVTSCGAAPAMEAVVNCIDQKDNGFTVNEGYPPTPPGTVHSDPGHSTGCAIDVHVTSCAGITAFAAAAKACGVANPLNEYGPNSGMYCPNAVPPAKTYLTTTGGNIHIDAPKGKGGGC